MPFIVPNTTAVPQTVSSAQIVVNGTACTWPADKIVEGVKVIHHIECNNCIFRNSIVTSRRESDD